MHVDSQDVTTRYCLKKIKTGYQSTVSWYGVETFTAFGGKYVVISWVAQTPSGIYIATNYFLLISIQHCYRPMLDYFL